MYRALFAPVIDRFHQVQESESQSFLGSKSDELKEAEQPLFMPHHQAEEDEVGELLDSQICL